MTWITTTDREDHRHYVRADGHVIDGHGAGRMRWTVTYPDGTYGMTDTLAEAKAWAGEPALRTTPKATTPPLSAEELDAIEQLATERRTATSNSTPLRAVRIDTELWSAAQAAAKAEGTTVSQIIREALAAHVKAYK